MIGGLMYLIVSRPDIVFATFVCARYQARPTAKHLKEVKRIFRYLRQTINMGLWYSKDSGFELIAYSDTDHAGCNDDCKSTSGGIQFLGDKLVIWSSKKQDCTTMSTTEDDIPCSPECKIVGQILLNHPLSYALTATADVPSMYLQQFWKTVSKMPNTKDTIKFKLNSQEIVYPKAGYQGVVDKVSAFYTKFLAQPWQTMFKLFNCCLTTRTFGHDQTKINILQLFHAIVNCTHVDYVALLWWDFLNYVFQNKDDDIPLVSVYSIGNVLFRGMLVPDAFLTDEIRVTDDYVEYETVFAKVSPTLTTDIASKKKRKQVAGETSSPRKLLKVTITQKKQSTTPLPPPCDNRERGEMAEATLLSLTLHKTALAAEAKENIAKVQEKLDEEEIEKMVEGEDDEESYASEFADSTEKEKKDDEKNDEKANDDEKKDETSSMETRK
ncbi:hypothetical protein Tco_1293010 [Tanacetum coccineum]